MVVFVVKVQQERFDQGGLGQEDGVLYFYWESLGLAQSASHSDTGPKLEVAKL